MSKSDTTSNKKFYTVYTATYTLSIEKSASSALIIVSKSKVAALKSETVLKICLSAFNFIKHVTENHLPKQTTAKDHQLS